MVRGKKLTDNEKSQIDALRAVGKTRSEIAKALNRSRTAVFGYVTGYRNHGQNKNTGRPRKLSKLAKRAIGRAASNLLKSAVDIKRKSNLNTSRDTVL